MTPVVTGAGAAPLGESILTTENSNNFLNRQRTVRANVTFQATPADATGRTAPAFPTPPGGLVYTGEVQERGANIDIGVLNY
jgi:hypothetical protein